MILLKLFNYSYGRHTWTPGVFSKVISEYRNYLTEGTIEHMRKTYKEVKISDFGGIDDRIHWTIMLETFNEPLLEKHELLKDKDLSEMIGFALRADLQKGKYDEKFSDFIKENIKLLNDHDLCGVERDLRERKSMFFWHFDKLTDDDVKFERLWNFIYSEVHKRGVEIWN